MKFFSIAVQIILLFSISGCRHETVFHKEKSFNRELRNINLQQLSIRRSRWLKQLNSEYNKAETMGDIAKLELLLENPDLSNADKNQTLLNYFERAALYMQMLIFPDKHTEILSRHIKNELSFELGSILLRCTLADKALSAGAQLPPSESLNEFNSYWQNIISNQQIEYAALLVNDSNAAEKIPRLLYPLHIIPPFKNLEEFRQYYFTPAHNAAREIYPGLTDEFAEGLPLILLKLMYRTPYELNDLYANDTKLKKDFSDLILELVWLWQSEQLYSNMQNSFIMAQDFQKSISQTRTLSPEMLDGCLKSQLAYELSVLKMLSKNGISPFEKNYLPQDNINQLPQSRTRTLQLMLKDIIKKL